MTREQTYRNQMKALGTYDPIFEPEISTLCQIEREHQRAKKAWSQTAPPGGKPSMLDEHYAVVQKLRAEMLQHRDALGLTPKALRKLRGAETSGPDQRDLLSVKLDGIANRISGSGEAIDVNKLLQIEDAFAGTPGFDEAMLVSEMIDAEGSV